MVKEEVVKPVANIASVLKGVSDFVSSFRAGAGRSQGGPPAAC